MRAPDAEWIAAAGGYSRRLREGERIHVGKAADCELVLDVAGVSRRHLALEVRGGRLYARDLNSTNGSACGGSKLVGAEAFDASDAKEIVLGGAERVTLARHGVDGGGERIDSAQAGARTDSRSVAPAEDRLAGGFGGTA